MSEWTLDSLKEYLDVRLTEMDKRTAAELAAFDKNALKSERQMEKRLDSVNEFRGQLADQVKTFLPRETYEAGTKAMDSRVTLVERQQIASLSEKRGGREMIAAIVGVVGFAVGLIGAGIFNR